MRIESFPGNGQPVKELTQKDYEAMLDSLYPSYLSSGLGIGFYIGLALGNITSALNSQSFGDLPLEMQKHLLKIKTTLEEVMILNKSLTD